MRGLSCAGLAQCTAMFESVVSDLLKTYLGDYVEGLDKDALSISVWKGACISIRERAMHIYMYI